MSAMNMKEIVALAKLAETLLPQVQPLVDAIKADTARVAEGKNFADDANTAKKGVFAKVVDVVEAIASATADCPQLRDWCVENTLGEFLHADKDTALATVKAYASTGKQVLLKLHTEQNVSFADIKSTSYGDLRKMLNPPSNAVAEDIADRIAKMVKFIAKNGDKHGVAATDTLDAMRQTVEASYNRVKGSKDAKSAAAKAAKELAANRQQSPSEATTVEKSAKAA